MGSKSSKNELSLKKDQQRDYWEIIFGPISANFHQTTELCSCYSNNFQRIWRLYIV